MIFTKSLHFLLIISTLIPFANAQETSKTAGLISSNYTLKPLDIVEVKIYKEPDLDQEVRLGQDGLVNLTLIGRIKLEGLTISEANQHIMELYNRDYLVNPQVSINLISYTEQRAYVHGQVQQPGPVVIPPEETMTLSQVISAAGSMTRIASNSIQVTRTDEKGKKDVQTHYFDEILEDPEANDVLIYHGDSIFVPESWF